MKKTMKTLIKTMTAAAAITCAAGAALAGGEGDYGLWVQDGKVMTAIGDHTTQTLSDFGERVFAADLLAVPLGWEAEEPGIFIQEGSLPDNTAVGFRIMSNLLYWDGTGEVSASEGFAMQLQFGPESRVTPGDNSIVDGFTINYDADAAGGFDEHFDFLLPDLTPTGVYFLEMSFTLSGFEDSVSTWTVFNAGLDELQHDAAIEYAENVLVPAPGTAFALGGVGLLAMRRRR